MWTHKFKLYTFLLLGEGISYMPALHLQHHLHKTLTLTFLETKNSFILCKTWLHLHSHFDECKQRQFSNEDHLQHWIMQHQKSKHDDEF